MTRIRTYNRRLTRDRRRRQAINSIRRMLPSLRRAALATQNLSWSLVEFDALLKKVWDPTPNTCTARAIVDGVPVEIEIS